MNNRERGFGLIQVVLGIIGVVAISVVAVPKYQDYVVRSKMSEAFSIIADTKTKLTEFYTFKRRFPESDKELETISTEMFSPPEFVEKVVLNSKNKEHEIMIQVYFRPDVIPGDGFNDQYLYVAGNSSSDQGVTVVWSCGLRGMDEKYLPTRCQG